VFVHNFSLFSPCVSVDLLHHLIVVTLHRLNLILQLLDQCALLINIVIVLLLAQIDSVGVLFHNPLLRGGKCILVSLLLLLEFVKASSVFQHLLVVLIAPSFKFFVLLLLQQFELLLVVVLHVLLRSVQLVVLVPGLQLGIG